MKKSIFALMIFALCLSSSFCATVYKSKAVASFYAHDFHGKKTSNGENFNMWAMTCANKMLPFDTVLRVTNLKNGKAVLVRVNDRGPFVKDRELDLSKGAASKLDMIASGTATVKIEIVKLGAYTKASIVTGKKACAMAGIEYKQFKVKNNSSSATTSKSENNLNSETFDSRDNFERNENQKNLELVKKAILQNKNAVSFDIQLGSFKSRENAIKFGQKVKRDGFSNVVLQHSSKVEGFYRVVLRDIKKEDLEKFAIDLESRGYKNFSVKVRN